MRILLLGPGCLDLTSFLHDCGDSVINTEMHVNLDTKFIKDIEFIISFRYRHILKSDLLRKFEKKAINLHISLLPWNRGADPNLWSFLENTSKGVTIHYIDHGIDTGDIIAQRYVNYYSKDTLRSSYERLLKAIIDLFKQTWPNIRAGNVESIPQSNGGSYHKIKDRDTFKYLLTEGWDTPVVNVIGKALVVGGKST